MANNITKVEKVRAGIKLAVDEIRETYGNFGLNKIIGTDEYPYNKISNDAYTIIHAISTDDLGEKQGLDLFKELMDRQNSIGGDGRKTTAIIADKLLDISFESTIPKIQLKGYLDGCIDTIDKEVDALTKEMTLDDVYTVAKVSSESDEIAHLLEEVYKLTGKDGVIEVEASNTPESSYRFIEGTRFMDLGFLTPALVHDDEAKKEGKTENRAVYEKPLVLITKQKIDKPKQIDPILNYMVTSGKNDLVILANDMDSKMISSLIATHKSLDNTLNILVLRPPVLWKDGIFEDFSKCTGATIIDQSFGTSLEKLDVDYLGTCDKIITTKDETILLGTQDLDEHIADLKMIGDNESLLRVNWLSNKTVILKIGGNSEQDIYYKRMKCQDAINSCRSALNHGVVLGSGITLKKIAETLPEANFGLREALLEPYRQLCLNAGVEKIEIDNIYDSAYVVKQAIRNAIGLASTVLTIGSALPLIKK